MLRRSVLLLISVFAVFCQTPYQKPPKQVLDVLNAPAPPVLAVNPAGTHAVILEPARYPSIAELAQPMLRLAGVRINPKNNGPHRPMFSFLSLAVKPIAGGAEARVALPAGARISMPRWSPDGKRFAFTNTTPAALELWIGDAGGKAHRLAGVRLSAALHDATRWMPDNRTLLVQLVPEGRGNPPDPPPVPSGPNVQETLGGKAAPVRTYQDLLASPHDENLFDYYATAQLAWIDADSGKAVPIGKPAIYGAAMPSPDGRHLLVERIHKPYSYLHPYFAFPREVEVWDRAAKIEYKVASLPLADSVPIEGVSTGPRAFEWRATEPATLVWVEALDGGNPKEKVPHRDRILFVKAPFTAPPAELFKTEQRFAGIEWTEKGDLAFVRDYERNRRWIRTFALDLNNSSAAPRVIFSRSVQDRYNAPGEPVERMLPNGQRAIRQSGEAIFLTGPGATPQGDRPFLDRFDLKTRKPERLFRSEGSRYESVAALLDGDGSRFIVHRESPSEPPNFYVRTRGDEKVVPLTNYRDPAPQLRAIRKQLVTYQRPDGVKLSFTLYLPPDYKEGTRLPTVVWAYPMEYNDPDTAGQVVGSPQRFTTLTGMSHLFLLLAGYAVLDNAAMPVVGDSETVNNTYVEQIVMNAKAAIAKAAEMGVTDPNRVGVGGHSYGAFMTANLLAHCDLFRAGIARSGAHNRTLTPFGFQSERRTLWEAPDLYLKMSPFMYADKIKRPLLLIHGEADNNPGTFPIQSERMYQAVRGNGGTVRLVTLPLEAHGYAARESIEHTLYEMISWFDRWVKNAQ